MAVVLKFIHDALNYHPGQHYPCPALGEAGHFGKAKILAPIQT